MPSDAKRREARKRRYGAQAVEPEPTSTIVVELGGPKAEEQPKKRPTKLHSSQEEQKHQRFIVFIGNLPYTAADASIHKHFAKVRPKSIRHRTDKETGKSKGFAFLEFEGYDRMKTCLELYHQSNFDDGESPARKLNVELTAGGGGGKSRDRKNKLRIKNGRLNEQRRRRVQEEEKQNKKIKKEKAPEPTQFPTDNGDVHRSRRSRLAISPNDT